MGKGSDASGMVALPLGLTVLLAVICVIIRATLRKKMDFILCDVMEDNYTEWGGCTDGRQPIPSFSTSQFYGLVEQRALEIKATDRQPVFLHIGASDFTDDVVMWNSLISTLGTTTPRMILAEAQPDLIPLLTENSERLHLSGDRVSIVNAAVGPQCPGDNFTMYAFSKELQKLFTRKVPTYGHTTTDKARIARSPAGAAKDPNNFWRHEWELVANLPNIMDYVEELPVPCTTVQGLMTEVSITSADIAAVVIDTEGMDNWIMLDLLRQHTFAPAFILFEGDIEFDTEGRGLWDRLLDQGYLVGITMNGANIAAVHSRFFRWPWYQLLLRGLSCLAPCNGLCA